MNSLSLSLLAAAALAAMPAAADQLPAPFLSLFQTLVEIDTTAGSGGCSIAASKAAEAVRAQGFPAADMHRYASADHPGDGGLIVTLRAARHVAKPLLLVAHVDTVPADPAEWTHPPFRLAHDGAYFYGRGVADNKAIAAILIDLLVRLDGEGWRPGRDIAVALTCGEETADAFNGAHFLATEGRALVDPGLVLVPSGGATRDAAGRRRALTLAISEKSQQNFAVVAIGTGSHASQPRPGNAIYILADALRRIGDFDFPVALSPVVRTYFQRLTDANAEGATALRALLANPADLQAQAAIAANPAWNAMIRTTCVATTIDTGRQVNTVAPTAAANINCRLLPGETVAAVQAQLTKIVADSRIRIVPVAPLAAVTPPPPPPADLVIAVRSVATGLWPGVTVAPIILTGATDARHFNAVGIPAYGLTALFYDPDGSRVHAPDERIRVSAVTDGREFLYRLIKRLGR